MTVQTNNNSISYVGNGSTVHFDYDYLILNASHLKVYFGDVLQTSGYVVSGVSSQTGGTVAFAVAPPNGTNIALIRDVPFLQLTDYQPYDAFPAESHERALDLLTMMTQQLKDELGRTMQYPVGGNRWDAKGNEIINVGTGSSGTSAANIDQVKHLIASEVGDDPSASASVRSREALRRSYAEAGYNLVDGSFEAGGTLVNTNDVLLQERTGKAFSGPAGTVAAGTNPASGGFVDMRYNVYGAFANPQAVAASSVSVGARVRIASRSYALFEVKAGTSPYPLVCPQLSPGLYLSMVAESGELTSSGAGATDNDDTFILDQLIRYAKSINAAVKIDRPVKLKTPLDAHTYIRLPSDFTIYSENPRVYRVMIQPPSGVVRDAGLCLESFQGLQGPEPAMCSGTVAKDIYLTMNAVDGGQVKVGHCIIGALFRTMFIRPYASGFTRHNILLCRAFYSSFSGLFGRAGKGSGVTIGKHPDVNQSWDGAVNGIEIDEVWGHTNGQGGTWVADTNEDIGYGVGLYGEIFSLNIGTVIAELTNGAGFQNKMSYGNVKIGSMYLEANSGHDFYSAKTNSAGISWQIPNIFIAQGANVKIKPDPNTSASLIGFPFVISATSGQFDLSGVNFANVKLSRETSYVVRNILGPIMSVDYKIAASEDGNLNSFSVACKGPNPVSSLEFNNNVELVFIPYQTTTSTGQFVYQITKDGVDQGTSLGKTGPFTAYQPVKLTSWSGSYNAFYSFKVLGSYDESCPGRFVIRARHL